MGKGILHHGASVATSLELLVVDMCEISVPWQEYRNVVDYLS